MKHTILFFLCFSIFTGCSSPSFRQKKVGAHECFQMQNIDKILSEGNEGDNYCSALSLLDEKCFRDENVAEKDTLIRIYITKRFQNAIILNINKYHDCENYSVRLKTFPEKYGNLMYIYPNLHNENITYNTYKKIININEPLSLEDFFSNTQQSDTEADFDAVVCYIEIRINNYYRFKAYNISKSTKITIPIKSLFARFFNEEIDLLDNIL